MQKQGPLLTLLLDENSARYSQAVQLTFVLPAGLSRVLRKS